MRILWLCNIMLPAVAQQCGLPADNKEGWLSGLLDSLCKSKEENMLELGIAFPAPEEYRKGSAVRKQEIWLEGQKVSCFGFAEDTAHPERYDESLEDQLREIVSDYAPDVVHCFGTEYPHTLAMCRTVENKERLLISIQGLCSVCGEVYYANLPEKMLRKATLRDVLRKDSLTRQKEKFILRGEMEKEAIALAGNVAGRTDWDRYYTDYYHPGVRYFTLNETLRSTFYEGTWSYEACRPHSIFMSQGDYPIKGLHYMLEALAHLAKRYPDVMLYVAGNRITNHRTLKDKIKISGYGKYLLKQIKEYHLEEHVTFLGKCNPAQMKEAYLRCHTYVCCSAMENSPNSLGEALLLGVPCVATDVGGTPSIFDGGRDGILVAGCRLDKAGYSPNKNSGEADGNQRKNIAEDLAQAVSTLWESPKQAAEYSENARKHAEKNYNPDRNEKQLTEIYAQIVKGKEEA